MAEKQKTIAKSVAFSGRGLHTGQIVDMTVKPAPENHGYVFQRVDLEDKPLIHALVENVVDTSRSTVIEENGAKVGTIEHVLSALYGLAIDNALIEISASETPILDGSAKPYVDAFLQVGIVEQNADKEFFVVKKNVSYSDDEAGLSIMTFPDDDFSLNVMIDYNSPFLGNQYASLNKLSDYREEISPCRTFVLFRDLEVLLRRNLIKGGDLDNAIVIMDRKVDQEELDRLADLFNKPRMTVTSPGVLNNIDLRFQNEPARHKLLDLMGDLALVGRPIKGKILATRPGHHSNVQFARELKRSFQKTKNAAPEYDPNEKPVCDIRDIMNRLPHRPPFLLVDKVLHLDQQEVVGVKNVTMNEPFFVGHFPGAPVMPGVLIIEALAQCGGMLVLNTVPDPENYLTYFMMIDKVKFRRQVGPGDTLLLKMELMTPIRRGVAHMKAQAFVGDTLVTEGELMAQIVKVKGFENSK